MIGTAENRHERRRMEEHFLKASPLGIGLGQQPIPFRPRHSLRSDVVERSDPFANGSLGASHRHSACPHVLPAPVTAANSVLRVVGFTRRNSRGPHFSRSFTVVRMHDVQPGIFRRFLLLHRLPGELRPPMP